MISLTTCIHEALPGSGSVIVTGPASRSTIANEYNRVALGRTIPCWAGGGRSRHAGTCKTSVLDHTGEVDVGLGAIVVVDGDGDALGSRCCAERVEFITANDKAAKTFNVALFMIAIG